MVMTISKIENSCKNTEYQMGKFMWLKSPKTNGENIIKCMVFIVFSSAFFLHWCLFFTVTWSAHIGERPNHKIISVWTQQGLPGQSPPCGVTQGCGIFEVRSLLSSHRGCNWPSYDLSSNVMNTLSIGKFWFNIIKNFMKDLESEIVYWCCGHQ